METEKKKATMAKANAAALEAAGSKKARRSMSLGPTGSVGQVEGPADKSQVAFKGKGKGKDSSEVGPRRGLPYWFTSRRFDLRAASRSCLHHGVLIFSYYHAR